MSWPPASEAELAAVLEVVPWQRRLAIRGTVGWPAPPTGGAGLAIDGSFAGAALTAGRPLAFDASTPDDALPGLARLRAQGVAAGLAVAVGGPAAPFAVLVAAARSPGASTATRPPSFGSPVKGSCETAWRSRAVERARRTAWASTSPTSRTKAASAASKRRGVRAAATRTAKGAAGPPAATASPATTPCARTRARPGSASSGVAASKASGCPAVSAAPAKEPSMARPAPPAGGTGQPTVPRRARRRCHGTTSSTAASSAPRPVATTPAARSSSSGGVTPASAHSPSAASSSWRRARRSSALVASRRAEASTSTAWVPGPSGVSRGCTLTSTGSVVPSARSA